MVDTECDNQVWQGLVAHDCIESMTEFVPHAISNSVCGFCLHVGCQASKACCTENAVCNQVLQLLTMHGADSLIEFCRVPDPAALIDEAVVDSSTQLPYASQVTLWEGSVA